MKLRPPSTTDHAQTPTTARPNVDQKLKINKRNQKLNQTINQNQTYNRVKMQFEPKWWRNQTTQVAWWLLGLKSWSFWKNGEDERAWIWKIWEFYKLIWVGCAWVKPTLTFFKYINFLKYIIFNLFLKILCHKSKFFHLPIKSYISKIGKTL